MTRPAAETVAVPVLADCHVDEAVTSCVAPSDMAAVAVSCEVPIALTAEAAAEGVRFSVSDTGPGIPRHHLSHLFDRSWQAPRSDRAGLGLGFAVVRGIVEAHGSQIEVETALDYGSTFSFNMAPA